jgi:hypothetical protein
MQTYGFDFKFFENLTETYGKIKSTFDKIESATTGLQKKLEESQAPIKKMQSSMSDLGKIIGGAFAVHEVYAFGKESIGVFNDLTANAELLKTTFGAVKTPQVLKELEIFADKMGASIPKVQDTYVSLVNRGFIPTMDNMRQLSDFAVKSKKPIDQYMEAVLDAETLQFERLLEFGVKAKVEGNHIKMTYNNMTKTIGNNANSIRGYLLGLGNNEGIKGISEKLGAGLAGNMMRWQNSLLMIKNTFGTMLSPFLNTILPAMVEKLKETQTWLEQNRVKVHDWANQLVELGLRAGAVYGIFTAYTKIIALFEFIRGATLPPLIRDIGLLGLSIFNSGLQWLRAASFTGFYAGIVGIATQIQNTMTFSMFAFGAVISVIRNRMLWLSAAYASFNLRTFVSNGLIAISALATGGLTATFGRLGAMLSWATIQQTLLNVAMYLNPIGIVIAAVAALAAAFYGMFKLIDALFPNFFKGIVDWFGKAFDWVWNNFIKPLKDFFSWLFGMADINIGGSISMDGVNTAMDKLKMPTGLDLGLNDKMKGTSGGQGASVSGGANIKHININIGKLIERQEIHATTVKESAGDIKRFIIETVLSALNDYNYSN